MHYSPGRSNKYNHREGPPATPSLDDMPEFMTPEETAKVVRKTINSLAQDRYLTARGIPRGLPYIKAGRKILYARADILAYLAAGRNDPREEATA
jgi:hypothetical protein